MPTHQPDGARRGADAAALIERLGLEPHPEGGWFTETWRDPGTDGARGSGTAIYYLLEAGQRSAWHRVDATEIWHHYAGAPLRLELWDGVRHRGFTLGDNLLDGQVPQAVVEPGEWQAAVSLGELSLVGCTVSPAFEFDGFELAPPGWSPGQV
ncbi:MAG TPA: cupin domain-containing protein [Microthrixaceae bacterium]|nr:cupin domain-containing protein [Microthrixaceae bacterium]